MPGYWPDTLEQMPEATYWGSQEQWKTPNMKKYFQTQFSNIQNRYFGQGAQTMMGGGIPTQRFTDFLQNFNWGQNYQEQGGGGQQNTSQFNPFTRWMT